MKKTLILAALAASAATVAGCTPETDKLTPLSNPSISSVQQPVVQRTDYVFDVNGYGGGIADGELTRLDAWFEALNLRYGDRVAIDEAAGYADASARTDVAKVAARYGLLLSEGAPVTAGRVQPGSVRVVVSRTEATVPGCPSYDQHEIGARHRTEPNYGCAANSNLAAMIADPNDLIRGRSGPDQLDYNNKAIKTYRERTPAKDLKVEAAGSGK